MGIKNILDLFIFKEDYEDFEDEEFEDRKSAKSSVQQEEETEEEFVSIPEGKTIGPKGAESDRKVRPVKMDRTVNSKVVPIKSSPRNLEVCIMKPTSFADSQDICDMLLSGRAAVVNLEGFDPVEAQRIMDFISGCVYAINGRLHQISKYIFIFSPDSIDISGDYLDLTQTDGFGVPTINKEF